MSTNNLRLLIVDDEEAARYGMRRALQTFGCDIAEAESAESAHALMRTSKFDLLLLDVNLPGLSGLDFLRQIQTEAETSKAEAPHVIIITAHGSERLAVEAVKSGAYDYLNPFDVDTWLVVKTPFGMFSCGVRNSPAANEIESSHAVLCSALAAAARRGMLEKVQNGRRFSSR